MPAPMLSRTGGTLLAAPHASTMPSMLSGPLMGAAAVNVGAANDAVERPFVGALLARVAAGVPSSADIATELIEKSRECNSLTCNSLSRSRQGEIQLLHVQSQLMPLLLLVVLACMQMYCIMATTGSFQFAEANSTVWPETALS